MRNITIFIAACLIASNACAWRQSQQAEDEPTPYPKKIKNQSAKHSSQENSNQGRVSDTFKEQLSHWKNQDGLLDLSLVSKDAQIGNAAAQVLLASCYFEGNGVEKNSTEGFGWYKKAAEGDDPTGQFETGRLYLIGEGTPQNLQEASYWLTKCSQNSNSCLFMDEEGKPFQDRASKLLNDPRLYPYRAKAMAAQMLEKQSKEVSDPEAGKYGGPPTLTVLKLSQGNSSVSMQNDMSVIAGAIMQGVAQVKIKENKRGEPLESLISLQIPKGTKVFPIRVLLTSAQGAEQQQDFYFYKDSFGDWAQVPKPAN